MNVVVTGASSGIGRATAIAYARRGAAVGLIARRGDRLAEVAREVTSAGGSASIATADVANRPALEAAIEAIVSEHGGTDVLVNNAGMPAGDPFVALDVERIERVTAVNYLSVVYATKAVLPGMIERGNGSIVSVASIAGTIAVPGAAPYAATKHALTGLMGSLAPELARFGIRVAVVHPGPVRTESFPHARLRRILVVPPERIANVIVRASERGRTEVMVPGYYRVFPALAALAPGLYRWLLSRYAR